MCRKIKFIDKKWRVSINACWAISSSFLLDHTSKCVILNALFVILKNYVGRYADNVIAPFFVCNAEYPHALKGNVRWVTKWTTLEFPISPIYVIFVELVRPLVIKEYMMINSVTLAFAMNVSKSSHKTRIKEFRKLKLTAINKTNVNSDTN